MDNVAFIDKWTHLVMYGGTTAVIWWEYVNSHHHLVRRKLFVYVLGGMIVLGGVIELLQHYATTTRSGEFLDFIADSLGVIIGTLLGYLWARWKRCSWI